MRIDQSSVPSSPVIFNLGNNNALSEQTVVEIFEVIKNQPQIIVVNTAVPRPWRDSNNAIISKVASNYANVKLVDWDRISKDRPELFAPDGVHLSPAGSDVYVDLVLSVLVKRDRINLLEAIITSYLNLVYSLASIKMIEVSTAFAFTNLQKNTLIKKLKELTNAREIRLVINIDSSLIGGFLIKTNSKVIDFTVKNQLQLLAKHLDSVLEI